MATCPGGLKRHTDGTIAGCTNDPDCVDYDARHEGDPKRCFEWFARFDYCGVHPCRTRSHNSARAGNMCAGAGTH